MNMMCVLQLTICHLKLDLVILPIAMCFLTLLFFFDIFYSIGKKVARMALGRIPLNWDSGKLGEGVQPKIMGLEADMRTHHLPGSHLIRLHLNFIQI